MFPGVTVVPVMGTGATDGLYLRNAGIPTYGVEGIFYELDDNRAHGRDERVGVKQYLRGAGVPVPLDQGARVQNRVRLAMIQNSFSK